jgi:hypothetical protein
VRRDGRQRTPFSLRIGTKERAAFAFERSQLKLIRGSHPAPAEGDSPGPADWRRSLAAFPWQLGRGARWLQRDPRRRRVQRCVKTAAYSVQKRPDKRRAAVFRVSTRVPIRRASLCVTFI